MILRSRKIPSRIPKELHSTRNPAESISVLTPQSMSRRQERVPLKSPAVNILTTWDDAVTPCSRKRTLRQVQHLQDFIEHKDLRTPNQNRCAQVHFKLDESSPDESGVSSPIVVFFSPDISRSEVQQKSIPDHPHLSHHLPEEEAREEFNPYKFICSAQAASDTLRLPRSVIPCKTRSTPESTLVLALEEVLVESSLLPQTDAQFTFLTCFQDTDYKVYLKLRPCVREFLETLCKSYEIFVFTTAKQEYARPILEILDPQKKLIRHRLYQDHCVCVSGHYIKDLNVLHRDLAKTVVLDTVAYTLPFHLANRIPVKRWSGNQTDKELLTLIPVLERMTHMEDVRLVISQQFHVDEFLVA